jgi:hypothetical protein
MQGVMNMKWTKAFFAIALLSGLSAAASALNLVANPGFETGNFTGWSESGWGVGTSGTLGLKPNSGLYFAYNGCVGPVCLAHPGGADLSQVLTTVAGQTYNLSFYTSNNPSAPTPSELDVYWGGTQVVALNPVPGAAPNYTEYTGTVTATGTSTDLEFLGRQDPAFFALDDVSVTPSAVPLPASAWLLLSGLVAVGAMARKQRDIAA